MADRLEEGGKEAVWAAVEVANAIAPSNARIARKSVLLVTAQGVIPLDADRATVIAGFEVKQIPIADKGTPLRPKTYVLFKDEIDSVYNGAF